MIQTEYILKIGINMIQLESVHDSTKLQIQLWSIMEKHQKGSSYLMFLTKQDDNSMKGNTVNFQPGIFKDINHNIFEKLS